METAQLLGKGQGLSLVGSCGFVSRGKTLGKVDKGSKLMVGRTPGEVRCQVESQPQGTSQASGHPDAWVPRLVSSPLGSLPPGAAHLVPLPQGMQ